MTNWKSEIGLVYEWDLLETRAAIHKYWLNLGKLITELNLGNLVAI